MNPLSIRSHSPIGKFWFISLVLDPQLDGSYQKYHALAVNYPLQIININKINTIILLNPIHLGKLFKLCNVFYTEYGNSNISNLRYCEN